MAAATTMRPPSIRYHLFADATGALEVDEKGGAATAGLDDTAAAGPDTEACTGGAGVGVICWAECDGAAAESTNSPLPKVVRAGDLRDAPDSRSRFSRSNSDLMSDAC